MTDTNPDAQGGSPVHDLIRQREQLRSWLDKLGSVSTGAPSRVAERVRADYEDRLRRVTEELSLHRDDILRDLEQLRVDLGEAEQRRTQAADVLEEARLRHMIGELSEEEWGEQQAALQGQVDAAAADVERAQGEVDRLSALAQDVDGAAAAPAEEPAPVAEETPAPVAEETPAPEEAAAPEAASESAPAAAEAPQDEDEDVSSWLEQLAAATGEAEKPSPEEPAEEEAADLPWLEEATQPEGWTPDSDSDGLEFLEGLDSPAKPEPAESLADDDLAFLEELDRAISGSPSSQRGTTPPATPPAAPPAAGTGGGGAAPTAAERQSGGPLLCKECGAINEPHSWYCEVCGSEL